MVTSVVENEVFSKKNRNRKANSIDPDETGHYDPSHQDLRCFCNRTERVKRHRPTVVYNAWHAGKKISRRHFEICVLLSTLPVPVAQ